MMKIGCGMALAISAFLMFSSLVIADNGDTGNGIPPILYNPSPDDNATDVNLSPLLSIKIYDDDGGMVDVYFYDKWDGIIGIDRVNSTKPTIASVRWNGLAMDRTYGWYIKAIDDANLTGYFGSNDTPLTFTTMIKSPPLVSFYVMDEGYWKVCDASIKCLETDDVKKTNEYGYVPIPFDCSHSGREYHFEIRHEDYETQNINLTIPDAGKRIDKYIIMRSRNSTMGQPIIDKPSGPDFSGALLFIFGEGNLGLTILAIIAFLVVVSITRWLVMPSGVQIAVLGGLPLLFTALGWFPLWLMVISVAVALFMLIKAIIWAYFRMQKREGQQPISVPDTRKKELSFFDFFGGIKSEGVKK